MHPIPWHPGRARQRHRDWKMGQVWSVCKPGEVLDIAHVSSSLGPMGRQCAVSAGFQPVLSPSSSKASDSTHTVEPPETTRPLESGFTTSSLSHPNLTPQPPPIKRLGYSCPTCALPRWAQIEQIRCKAPVDQVDPSLEQKRCRNRQGGHSIPAAHCGSDALLLVPGRNSWRALQ